MCNRLIRASNLACERARFVVCILLFLGPKSQIIKYTHAARGAEAILECMTACLHRGDNNKRRPE